MKLSTREAVTFLAKPDVRCAGLLIYGGDVMRVAMKRQQVIAAIVGPNGDEEMRLSRMSGPELRKDPAALLDAVKSVSFFPGQRVAFVEEASDSISKTLSTALNDWQEGDANIIVTAGSLNARSALRKTFETHSNAYALGVYDDPPSREEIETEIKRAGLAAPSSDGMQALIAFSRSHDPGEFRQTLAKLAMYKLDDSSPLTPDDVSACMPATTDAAMDDIIHAAAEARSGEIGPLMRRLSGQGVQPVGICISAMRHFRALYNAASDPAGASSGISKIRPPVFGARRDRMLRQAQNWGVHRLESALQVLIETDLTLRSSQPAPQMALMERSLIRLSMLGKR